MNTPFMKSMKSLLFIALSLLSFLAACSTQSDSENEIFRNQTGLLRWAGPPAADGAGMLFEAKDVQYGVPGTPEDYPEIFYDAENPVEAVADFRLSGRNSIRGWGVTFPEIEILKIRKLD